MFLWLISRGGPLVIFYVVLFLCVLVGGIRMLFWKFPTFLGCIDRGGVMIRDLFGDG